MEVNNFSSICQNSIAQVKSKIRNIEYPLKIYFNNEDDHHLAYIKKKDSKIDCKIIDVKDQVEEHIFFSKFNILNFKDFIHDIKNQFNSLSLIKQIIEMDEESDQNITQLLNSSFNEIDKFLNHLDQQKSQYDNPIKLGGVLKYFYQNYSLFAYDSNCNIEVINSPDLIKKINSKISGYKSIFFTVQISKKEKNLLCFNLLNQEFISIDLENYLIPEGKEE